MDKGGKEYKDRQPVFLGDKEQAGVQRPNAITHKRILERSSAEILRKPSCPCLPLLMIQGIKI